MPGESTRSTIDLADVARALDEDVLAQVRHELENVGTVLLRAAGGFDRGVLRALGRALSNGSLQGSYGELPHVDGDREIFSSTPYPNRERILWHHEAAHTDEWPHVQLFACAVAAPAGGATGTADSREVWARLPARTATKFATVGLRYIRNFHAHLGVEWRDALQVSDEDELADVCARRHVEHEWRPDGVLRTSFVTAATATADDRVAFANQILLHHPCVLSPRTQDALTGLFGEREAFPRHVQFGDGTEIPDALVGEILTLYDSLAVRTPWRPGDILILDNRTTAHARDPFEGHRQIEVALGTFRPRPLVATGVG